MHTLYHTVYIYLYIYRYIVSSLVQYPIFGMEGSHYSHYWDSLEGEMLPAEGKMFTLHSTDNNNVMIVVGGIPEGH